MAKWHLNKTTGEHNKCTAKPGNCPLGGGNGTENHFNTKKEASEASEQLLKQKFGQFATNSREVKQQQTKQVETLFKIYNQLDDAGYNTMKDWSNLIVRNMVEGKPQKAKRFMDEAVQDLSRLSNEYSTVLNTDWKMGVENLPETIAPDKKDITSKRLQLLFKASDYFDDAGIDMANDNAASILVMGGPFNKNHEKETSQVISDFSVDISRRAEDANWLKPESEKEFNNIMNEYYSINQY